MENIFLQTMQGYVGGFMKQQAFDEKREYRMFDMPDSVIFYVYYKDKLLGLRRDICMG